MREDWIHREAVVVPETSSGPPVIPEEQRSLFREVLTHLEERNIPFAVAGAFALQEHTGIYRDTKDLDLFLTSRNVKLALESLHADGFECEECDPVWLYKVHRGDFFVDLITGMSNAAIVVEDSWIERAKPAVVHGVETRVLAAEELLASKLFVIRRERFDGADIAHVVYGTRGKVDWKRILQLAGEHWEILYWALVLFHFVYPAHADYVPRTIWEDLIGRFRDQVLHPDLKAKFRGSLVDDRMFAIDLKEWGLDDILEVNRQRRLRDIKDKPEAQ
jgi:predicted nucleotidyltransferase